MAQLPIRTSFTSGVAPGPDSTAATQVGYTTIYDHIVLHDVGTAFPKPLLQPACTSACLQDAGYGARRDVSERDTLRMQAGVASEALQVLLHATAWLTAKLQPAYLHMLGAKHAHACDSVLAYGLGQWLKKGRRRQGACPYTSAILTYGAMHTPLEIPS